MLNNSDLCGYCVLQNCIGTCKINCNHIQISPHGVVHELDLVQIRVELQGGSEVGEVVEVSVHRHHAPPHHGSGDGEHANVGTKVWDMIEYDIT